MASINKAIIVGNVGKDPDIRTMQNGSRVANLSIATSESWKDKQTGERKENTQWHRTVVWNENLVGVIEKYLSKGSKVYIEGQIETRKFQDKGGNDQYTTEIVLKNYNGTLVLLDKRESSQEAPASSSNDLDDDIPF